MLILQAMKNLLLIVISLVSFISCGRQETNGIPPNIIQPTEMVKINMDIKLIEAAINLNHYNTYIEKTIIDSLYQSVYSKHKIEKKDIDSSLNYYTKKPELLQAIYDSTLIQLHKLN